MNEEKKLKEWTKEYLNLEDQRNENIDKLEAVNKKLAILYSELSDLEDGETNMEIDRKQEQLNSLRNNYKSKKTESEYVYFIQVEDNGPIKIGMTSDPTGNSRLKAIQTSNPYNLKLLSIIESNEREIQKRFAKYRIKGEWFEPSPELFNFIKEKEREKLEHIKKKDFLLKKRERLGEKQFEDMSPEELLIEYKKNKQKIIENNSEIESLKKQLEN